MEFVGHTGAKLKPTKTVQLYLFLPKFSGPIKIVHFLTVPKREFFETPVRYGCARCCMGMGGVCCCQVFSWLTHVWAWIVWCAYNFVCFVCLCGHGWCGVAALFSASCVLIYVIFWVQFGVVWLSMGFAS